ncbi:MAG TPA: right-handed parallel beta-helix repeat-containing protein [Phycisphaerae bacterium]|nr:right-handed parallel beta-helix repeat-containing protein [Phycisphaerae bacterium]HNU46182.1 right-handed parallel beta-helix repeat-containing protein [Phycisphaerae bacterium]
MLRFGWATWVRLAVLVMATIPAGCSGPTAGGGGGGAGGAGDGDDAGSAPPQSVGSAFRAALDASASGGDASGSLQAFHEAARALYAADPESAPDTLLEAAAQELQTPEDLEAYQDLEESLGDTVFWLESDNGVAKAQQLSAAGDTSPVVGIYVNGINTSFVEAEAHQMALDTLLRHGPSGSRIDRLTGVGLHYNTSFENEQRSFWGQRICPFFFTANPPLGATCALFVGIGTDAPEAMFEKVLEWFGNPTFAAERGGDIGTLAVRIAQHLNEGYGVLLIGHSQGNFKIVQALNLLWANYTSWAPDYSTAQETLLKSVGVAAIGCPADYRQAIERGIRVRKFNIRQSADASVLDALNDTILWAALQLWNLDEDIVSLFDDSQPAQEYLWGHHPQVVPGLSGNLLFPEIHDLRASYLRFYGPTIRADTAELVQQLGTEGHTGPLTVTAAASETLLTNPTEERVLLSATAVNAVGTAAYSWAVTMPDGTTRHVDDLQTIWVVFSTDAVPGAYVYAVTARDSNGTTATATVTVTVVNDPAAPTGCTVDADCPEGVCDSTSGECVECVSSDHCPDGQVCEGHQCYVSCTDIAPGNLPAQIDTAACLPSGGTYHVVSDVEVAWDQTLWIEPGVTIIFDGPYAIAGRLVAEGTTDSVITFTAAEPTPGFWSSVRLHPGSILSFCELTYAQNALELLDYLGIPADNWCKTIEPSTIIIADSKISNCSMFGVTRPYERNLASSTVRLERVSITGCGGNGVQLSGKAHTVCSLYTHYELAECTIAGNGGTGIQIVQYTYGGGHTWTIRDSRVLDNAGGGVALYTRNPWLDAYDLRLDLDVLMERTEIAGNGLQGVSVSVSESNWNGSYADVRIAQCSIHGNGSEALYVQNVGDGLRAYVDVDASECWWGQAPPRTEDLVIAPVRDGVKPKLVYEPWLTTPPDLSQAGVSAFWITVTTDTPEVNPGETVLLLASAAGGAFPYGLFEWTVTSYPETDTGAPFVLQVSGGNSGSAQLELLGSAPEGEYVIMATVRDAEGSRAIGFARITVTRTWVCGDGIVTPGEECDPPDGVTCDANCMAIALACTDSDAYALDLDVFVVGQTQYGDTLVDVCATSKILREYYCEGGVRKDREVSCPQGIDCVDGRCADPATVVCGNGYCQDPETPADCPQDCHD